jgi:hypothetical protein
MVALHLVGEKTDVVDAVLRFVTFDAVVKGMNRQIGFAVGAEAVAAPLLAAQIARRDFAQAENLRVKKQHRFRVKRVVGDMAHARKFFFFALPARRNSLSTR